MTKTLFLLVIALALVGWSGTRLFGQAEESPGAAGAHEGASHEGEASEGPGHDAGPMPPKAPQRWPAVTVFLIGVMFFMAAVIGPIVRAQAPPEMPPTHSHDEPPGASHHHGHSGTINPVPQDVARLEDGESHGHHR